MKKVIAFFAFLLAAAGASATLEPAFASDPKGITIEKIVEGIAPGLLEVTDGPGSLSEVEPRLDSPDQAVRLNSKAPIDSSAISLTLEYAREAEVTKTGLIYFSGLDPSVSGLAQETQTGFRVITTLVSAPRSSHFGYKFDVPADATLQETPTNFLLTSDSKVLGIIEKPWALDAKGKHLKTHYEWRDQTLTQVLDENLGKLAYPVVLDPAWSYVRQYNLRLSPEANFGRLQNCFNCYFPVPGAPRNYPRFGQLLPLSMLGANFECTMGATYQYPGYREFQFKATRNHIDQYGSTIAFQLTSVGSQNLLIVRGFVVNEFGGPFGQWGYMVGAGNMWQSFATNLNSYTITK